MILEVLVLIAGLLLLVLGAEWLVRGGVALAVTRGISPVVVGLTVIAFGTSMPELVVSTWAAADGRGALALGNVVGSNIANVALVLGLAAVVRPLGVDRRLVNREIPAMIATSALFVMLVLDGGLDRVDGLVLMSGFAVYLLKLVREARHQARSVAAAVSQPLPQRRPFRDLLMTICGLALLIAGAHVAVGAAASLARLVGVSEFLVGFTAIAVGTSLPELATSMVAAARGEGDVAVGNVVGSNIFNTLAILGTAALVRPIAFEQSLIRFELPIMMLLSVLLVPIAWTGLRVARREGVLLLVSYGVFLLLLVARAAP